MPGFDGTGPRGMGSRTGGGRGFCPPIWPRVGPFGMRRGIPWPTLPVAQTPHSVYGAPWGVPYYGAATAPGAVPYAPQVTREQEMDFLKSQAETIRGQLEQIEARMRELEVEPGS